MTQPVWMRLPCLHTLSGDMGVTQGSLHGGATPGSAVFPAANDAIFVPFVIPQAVLIKRLFSINGSTASGNIDVGIYSNDGARIVSAGTTAQAGTSAPQFFDNTDFMLAPGRYYWAVAMDNGTGTLFRGNVGVVRLQASGCAKMATAFALPATATFAAVTAAFLPMVGAEIVRVL